MGRFTLRDEGKTIAVGKVLKYKPYSKGIVGTQAKKEVSEVTKQLEKTTITKSDVKELVFNMDTGETSEKKKDMEAIAEDEEDKE